MTPKVLCAGDQALAVEFSSRIDASVNARVIALAKSLGDDPLPGVRETVPSYRSLLVCYDPEAVRGAALAEAVQRRAAAISDAASASRLWRVPLLFGGSAGLDLEDLARMKSLSVEELIALFVSPEYRVYMIGFAPGFAYLGGLPALLHTPRLPTPRQRLEAGAVGIGGEQANINSVAGPSGWRFVGRTPLRLFDPARPEPFLLAAGDAVRFVPVSAAEAADLDAAVAAGETIVESEIR
jgi:inhibitor of KinA